MAASGAAGETRAQLLQALHLSGAGIAQWSLALIERMRGIPDARIAIANALWLRRDAPPSHAFVETLRTQYDAHVQALDFGSAQALETIEAWTRARSSGAIDRVIDATAPGDFAYLTNVFALEAAWTHSFDPAASRLRAFRNANGERPMLPFMSRDGNFATAQTAGCEILRLPYGSGTCAAYVLLPQRAGDAALMQLAGTLRVEQMREELHEERLRVVIPRFTARFDASLVAALRAMGVRDAFSSAADFSPMTASAASIAIADVRQSVRLTVDEAGTRAASAGAVRMAFTAARTVPRSFLVDRPFALALVEERDGTLLFAGLVRNLTADAQDPGGSAT